MLLGKRRRQSVVDIEDQEDLEGGEAMEGHEQDRRKDGIKGYSLLEAGFGSVGGRWSVHGHGAEYIV